MKNINFLLATLLIYFNLTAQDNSTTLYLDIAKSISTARGNIDLYFTEGSWTKTILSKKVIIGFAENQKANLKFSYSGGQLQDGSRISFSPGIHIWVKVPSGGLSLRLDTIWFDDNGKYKDWKVAYDNAGTNDPNQIASIQEALRLNDKSEHLFTSKVLKNFTDARKSDNNGIAISNNTPLLTSIIIKKANDSEPGLAVSFIPNSVIHLSKKLNSGTYDNVVSLSTGNFEIRYLEYDVLNKKVDCELTQFDINLQSGILQTSDLLINIGSNSKLKFNRLKFYHDKNSSELNGENGTLNAQVGGGTKISFKKTGRYKNELVFDNGEMNLFDFGYSCSDDTKTVFSIGGGSTLKVSTRSGSFSVCDDKGYISLASGILEAKLFGKWNSQNSLPDSHLIVDLLSVSLDGGYLPITSTNIIGIKSGFLKSESLRFDAPTFSSLVGEIKDLNVVVNDETKFKLPGGMQINIKEGSVIDGAEPNNPLKLDMTNNYVSGLFKFNINFSTLNNSSNELLSIHDGTLKMKLAVINNDTIKGRDIYFRGTSTITAQDAKINCALEFSDGSLISIRDKQPEFTSKIKVELNQSRAIEVNTPYIKINDDTRVFPLKLIFTLSESAVSQEGNISFTGQNIKLDELVISPKFTLEIPQGRGEHSNPDDPNSTDGKKGPDWTKVCQEVIFFDCPNPVGWAHFYAFPETYKINSSMKFSITEQTISFNFGSLEFDKALRWEKDGCDLDKWVGAIAAVAGSLVGGPLGATVGGIVGIKVGGDMESNIKGIINSGIAKKTTEFNLNRQWKIK